MTTFSAEETTPNDPLPLSSPTLFFIPTLIHSLPPELVAEIFQHGANDSNQVGTFAGQLWYDRDERYAFLTAVALVCKEWAGYAQELLHETVIIDSRLQGERFVDGAVFGKFRTDSLMIRGGCGQQFIHAYEHQEWLVSRELAMKIIEGVKGVRHLRIEGFHHSQSFVVSVFLLPSLAGLISLALSDMAFDYGPNQSITLPCLRQLSFHNYKNESTRVIPVSHSLFSATPQLTHLSVFGMGLPFRPVAAEEEADFASFCVPIAAQLVSFTLTTCLSHHFYSVFSRMDKLITLEIWSGKLGQPLEDIGIVVQSLPPTVPLLFLIVWETSTSTQIVEAFGALLRHPSLGCLKRVKFGSRTLQNIEGQKGGTELLGYMLEERGIDLRFHYVK